jgi:NADPH-dependent glutamate synthase beta subunit-like oxidoreductase
MGLKYNMRLYTDKFIMNDDESYAVEIQNYMTSMDRVCAAGDLRRGQSLVVWAIAEGREAARGIDQFLMGHSDLPTLETRLESLPRR